MLNVLLEILLNVGVALGALVCLTLLKNRKSMTAKEFSVSVFWTENRNLWIWTMSIIVIIAVLNGVSPESVAKLTDYFGLTLTDGPGGFAILAIVLLTSQKTTKTIAKKKAQIVNRESKLN